MGTAAALPAITPRAGTLYVFLHGLCIISEKDPRIKQPGKELAIVLPSVPGHVYRAGTWLAEDDIDLTNAPKVLQLRGVNNDGNKSFSASDNFIIDLRKQTSLTGNGQAAALIVPKPKNILSLLHAVDQNNFVVQVGSQLLKEIAMEQVLVYDYKDENGVFLDGHFWEPCATDGAISLHIISTSLEPETKEHEQFTEAALGVVLKDYPGLTFFNNPRPLVAPWIDPLHPHYGDYQSGPSPILSPDPQNGNYFLDVSGVANPRYAFAKAELEHPTLRFARIKRLGRLFQRNEAIEGLWSDPEPIGDRASNCATTSTN